MIVTRGFGGDGDIRTTPQCLRGSTVGGVRAHVLSTDNAVGGVYVDIP